VSDVDYEGFAVHEDPAIPDPPYVYGDHAARCRGCPPCIEAEEAWLAEREVAGV